MSTVRDRRGGAAGASAVTATGPSPTLASGISALSAVSVDTNAAATGSGSMCGSSTLVSGISALSAESSDMSTTATGSGSGSGSTATGTGSGSGSTATGSGSGSTATGTGSGSMCGSSTFVSGISALSAESADTAGSGSGSGTAGSGSGRGSGSGSMRAVRGGGSSGVSRAANAAAVAGRSAGSLAMVWRTASATAGDTPRSRRSGTSTFPMRLSTVKTLTSSPSTKGGWPVSMA